MRPPREPTTDECSACSPIGDGWFAIWYPQMGGYVGRAAVFCIDGGCVEVFVWHDGEFPFSDGDLDGWTNQPKRPVNLHHCDPDQFIEFGESLKRLQAAHHNEDQC